LVILFQLFSARVMRRNGGWVRHPWRPRRHRRHHHLPDAGGCRLRDTHPHYADPSVGALDIIKCTIVK